MDGRIAEFFADLAANSQGRLPPLHGLLRFEVSAEDGETAAWFVRLADGHTRVTQTGDDPTARWRSDRRRSPCCWPAVGQPGGDAATRRRLARRRPGAVVHVLEAAAGRRRQHRGPGRPPRWSGTPPQASSGYTRSPASSPATSSRSATRRATWRRPRARRSVSSPSTPGSCRHWVLTVDGERLNAFSRDDLTYFETRFFLVPRRSQPLRRRRRVGDPAPPHRRGVPRRTSRCSTTRRSPPSTRSGWRWAATSPTRRRSRVPARRRPTIGPDPADGSSCGCATSGGGSPGRRASPARPRREVDRARDDLPDPVRSRTGTWTRRPARRDDSSSGGPGAAGTCGRA